MKEVVYDAVGNPIKRNPLSKRIMRKEDLDEVFLDYEEGDDDES